MSAHDAECPCVDCRDLRYRVLMHSDVLAPDTLTVQHKEPGGEIHLHNIRIIRRFNPDSGEMEER